jgi:hypothetical protein
VPERHQYQQPVTDRVAAVTGGAQQLLNLGFRQVLALPVIGVLARPPRTVGFSDCERRNRITVFIGKFPLPEHELSA